MSPDYKIDAISRHIYDNSARAKV